MSMWNDLKKTVSDLADKAAKKTEELTDAAAMKIKIANKESERDAEYKILGKLIYEKLGSSDEQRKEELTRDIAVSIKKLDTAIAELSRLEREYNDAKAAREAEKNASRNSENNGDGKNDSSQSDAEFMNDFNEARKAGDQEAEKAKQASKDAADAAEQAKKMSDSMKDDTEKI